MRKTKKATTLEKVFAKNLKKYREALGLTQETLAEMVGSEAQHISRLERAVNSPKLDTLVKISKALNVSVDSLLGLKEKKTRSIYADRLSRILESATEHQKKTICNVAKVIISDKK